MENWYKTQNSADRDLNASQNLEKYAQMAKPCLDVKASTPLGFNPSAYERARTVRLKGQASIAAVGESKIDN
jgi:hypothetical protein